MRGDTNNGNAFTDVGSPDVRIRLHKIETDVVTNVMQQCIFRYVDSNNFYILKFTHKNGLAGTLGNIQMNRKLDGNFEFIGFHNIGLVTVNAKPDPSAFTLDLTVIKDQCVVHLITDDFTNDDEGSVAFDLGNNKLLREATLHGISSANAATASWGYFVARNIPPASESEIPVATPSG